MAATAAGFVANVKDEESFADKEAAGDDNGLAVMVEVHNCGWWYKDNDALVGEAEEVVVVAAGDMEEVVERAAGFSDVEFGTVVKDVLI